MGRLELPSKEDDIDLYAIEKLTAALALKLRVDAYPDPDAPGLEAGDLYVKVLTRDVSLYLFDCGEGRPNPPKDTRVATFIGTKRALFHLELNADFLPMTELVSPAALGLTMLYRNGHTFFRGVQVDDVPAIIDVLTSAITFKHIRSKRR